MSSEVSVAEAVRVRVAGKINLALLSSKRRPDGYHSLATVFQAVSVYDEIEARWAPPGSFSVRVIGDQAARVPTDESNLALRAARLLRDLVATGPVGVELLIRKSIPVAGGMAGGSADAAGALLACAVLWDLDVSPDALSNLLKLESGRIDLFAYPEAVFRWVAARNGRNPDDYETAFVLHEGHVYFALNKDTPDEAVARLQHSLDKLKAEGRVQAVIDSYLR